MNETVKSQLSALADAELGHDEARFLLRRIDAEPDLAAAWLRYHVAGECLRRQALLPVSGGFSMRVMQALPARRGRAAQWLRMGVGGAIAASVAVAALVLVRPATAPTAPGQAATLAVSANPALTAATDGLATAGASNNFSLLLRDPRSPLLDVEPASAVVSQGYLALQPVGLVREQPVWMRRALPVNGGTGLFAVPPTRMPAASASVAAPQARAAPGR
ncbi:MAG TPA: sigma-E factor negative regulatory protein [Rhodanobacteraceae bacterium]|nr:sigma-E factor negative regulatory protein [Rhodanobacteraceae bacterium]